MSLILERLFCLIFPKKVIEWDIKEGGDNHERWDKREDGSSFH